MPLWGTASGEYEARMRCVGVYRHPVDAPLGGAAAIARSCEVVGRIYGFLKGRPASTVRT
jgi:hypothetical protein